jgi:tRNA threonylcarbamoyladenosine biosynthesis protein TsaE
MVSHKFSDQTGLSKVIRSTGVEVTRRVGRDIGRALTSPMLIRLMGNLGCGKTAFVQGLAEGLEVPQAYYITSPTFTLINEYPGRLPLYHVDLYRLEGMVDLDDIGLDEIIAADGVVAVEWAEKLPPTANDQGLTIRFEIKAGDLRTIELIACGQPGCSLLKAIKH